MAETKFHDPPRPNPEILDEMPEPEPDWETIDRLIILMALITTEKLLRKIRREIMPKEIKAKVLARMAKLVAAYKRPFRRRRR